MRKINILMFLSKEILTDDRVYREAKALVDAGYEVTVIMWDRYGERKLKESVDGIDIVRIRSNGLMKLLPNNLFRNPIWWRLAYKKGLELYRSGYKFDIVHCHDLDTLKIGVWLKKKLGIKLIYDAHEIFGYMLEDSLSRFTVRMIYKLESSCIKNVDYIITVNHPLKDYFEKNSNCDVTIIMNCKDLVGTQYIPPKNDVFTICYFGNLVESRMFPELVDICGNIENIKFVIAGKKTGAYEEVEKRSKLYGNVEFLGTIPHTEVIPRTLSSNAIICMFDPNSASHRVGLPNKIFEAMVCGRPIIVTKGLYYSTEFVDKEKIGLSVSNTPEEIKQAIEKLRDTPSLQEELGKNALKAAIEKYNWGKEKEKLIMVYRGLEKSK